MWHVTIPWDHGYKRLFGPPPPLTPTLLLSTALLHVPFCTPEGQGEGTLWSFKELLLPDTWRSDFRNTASSPTYHQHPQQDRLPNATGLHPKWMLQEHWQECAAAPAPSASPTLCSLHPATCYNHRAPSLTLVPENRDKNEH